MLDLEKYKNLDVEELEELPEDFQNLFMKALDKFQSQFEVELFYTRYANSPKESGGIYGEENWVDGLVKSNVLDIKIGGWFEMDLRSLENGELPTIYCTLLLTIEGKNIGDCEAFVGWYDIENKTWNLSWDSY